MTNPSGGVYRMDTFETTITAQTDRLTLFIRGWKKWIDKGSGIFDLDEISFVGPAPEGFQSPVAQAALVNEAGATPAQEETGSETVANEIVAEDEANSETVANETVAEAETGSETMAETSAPESIAETPAETEAQTEPSTEFQLTTQNDPSAKLNTVPQPQVSVEISEAPQPEINALPVSGYGDDSIDYILMSGIILIMILLVSAIAATLNHRNMSESK
jgi:hypothetical protein